MVCIYCGGKTHITNSRRQRRSNTTWRRHHCTLCDTVFTSIEAADYSKHITVRSSHNDETAFSRDRLLLSLHKSLQHRPNPLSDAIGLCETVVNNVGQQSKQGILQSSDIRTTVIKILQRFDKLAAQYYSALHP